MKANQLPRLSQSGTNLSLWRRVGLCLLAGASLSACQIAPPKPIEFDNSIVEALEHIDEQAQAAIEPLAPPDEAIPSAVEAEEEQTRRFDVAAQHVSASEFYAGLVQDTDFSVVVHPSLTDTVSLQLKQVSVPDVMRTMRDMFGHDFTRHGQVYHVFPDQLNTEVFELDYLNVARGGASEVQVSAGKISDTGDVQGNNGNGTVRAQGSTQELSTIVSTRSEADLWGEVEAGVRALVSIDPESEVQITPQVGLVVVTARAPALRAVDEYLQRVQARVSRQVVLEAKIIEVTLNDGSQAGINWNTFGDASGGTFFPREVIDADDNISFEGGSEHRVAGELAAGVLDFFNPGGSAFALQAATGDFAATLNLLSTQGNVQVLSSPRIAAVNNQKAVIKVGSDEFFVTDVASNTVTAGSAINVTDSPELTPFFSGIALDVTPQISADGEVTLHVHPTVSEVTEQLKEIGGELVPLATSTIRESDTVVKARSGEIVVIGGLMQTTSSETRARVPWLSRIPLLGRLFRQKSSTQVKRELVILLKPQVVTGLTTAQRLRDSATRLRNLQSRASLPLAPLAASR